VPKLFFFGIALNFLTLPV